MPAFNYILILLAAVLLSNLINRFIPVMSPPIMQIALGVLVTLIPYGAFCFNFKLEPELFLVLFIAPLVFHSSMTADKHSLWRLKRPILGAAVVLVLITILVLGMFVHYVVHIITMAASAFALVSALGPTDVVAVSAATKRAAMPGEIMGVLTGESIVNDAMGIVCFQFAISAAMTGSFSISQGLLRFLALGAGGILIGLILTQLKYMLIHWLRELGVENVTLHILADILTPFIIYMCAELLSVSGVLAVFAAGVAHSFMREKFNPDTIKLQIAQESVWSVLSFTFDGLVFVMLGTQLPGIFQSMGNNTGGMDNWRIAGYILLITFLMMTIRFLWWVLAVRRKSAARPERAPGRLKSGLIFSLAGARGTVTLAIVMSLPLTMADGRPFPERELIILLAGGVIVVTLLVTNFILPLFTERKTDKEKGEAERAVYKEIMQTVISKLNEAITPETCAATLLVARTYYFRANLRPSGIGRGAQTGEERALRKNALLWEKENALHLLEEKKTGEEAAGHMLHILDDRLGSRGAHKRPGFLWVLTWLIRRSFRNRKRDKIPLDKNFWELSAADAQFVLDKLHDADPGGNSPAVEEIASEYEMAIDMCRNHADGGQGRPPINEGVLSKVAAFGYQIERELIQQMFEEGRLSRETAHRMRDNIGMLEARMPVD